MSACCATYIPLYALLLFFTIVKYHCLIRLIIMDTCKVFPKRIDSFVTTVFYGFFNLLFAVKKKFNWIGKIRCLNKAKFTIKWLVTIISEDNTGLWAFYAERLLVVRTQAVNVLKNFFLTSSITDSEILMYIICKKYDGFYVLDNIELNKI